MLETMYEDFDTDDYPEPAGYYQGDHEFDNGDGGKTSHGKCVVEIPKRYWHQFQGADDTAYCVALLPDVGGDCHLPQDDDVHQWFRLCGAPASSVLHPPDQFRHWCSVLEAGGDCMHFEDYD